MFCSVFQVSSDVGSPVDWVPLGHNRYLFQPSMVYNFSDAEAKCKQYGLGVHLAVLDTEEEVTLVTVYLTTHYAESGVEFWIGLVSPKGRK